MDKALAKITGINGSEFWEGERVLQDEYPELELYLTCRKCNDFGNCDDSICEGFGLNPPCTFYGVTEKTTGLSVLPTKELWPYAELAVTIANAHIDKRGGQKAVFKRVAEVLEKQFMRKGDA